MEISNHLDTTQDAARWRFLVTHAVLVTLDVRATTGFLSHRVWQKSPEGEEMRPLAQMIDLARAHEREPPQ